MAAQGKEGALHSDKVYYPYTDKRWDQVLCPIYWELVNFAMPREMYDFTLCNF